MEENGRVVEIKLGARKSNKRREWGGAIVLSISEYRWMPQRKTGLEANRLFGNFASNHKHHGPRQFRQALHHSCRACRPSWRPFFVHWISCVSQLTQLTREHSITFPLARPRPHTLVPEHHSTAAPSLSSPSLTPFALGMQTEVA